MSDQDTTPIVLLWTIPFIQIREISIKSVYFGKAPSLQAISLKPDYFGETPFIASNFIKI